MEDRNKQELIAIIKERLKEAEDLPYKEGAWEAYKSKYEAKSVRKILSPYWAAAAALALAGFAAVFIFRNSGEQHLQTAQQAAKENTLLDRPSTAPFRPVEPEKSLGGTEQGTTLDGPLEDKLAANKDGFASTGQQLTVLPTMGAQTFYQLPDRSMGTINGTPSLSLVIQSPKLTDTEEHMIASNLGPEFNMAQQANPNFAQESEPGKNLAPKSFNIANKFELGAFLSPSTTDQGFDVGGGLMLAYKLSNKLAVRTGASFNQYEVGLLASDMGAGSDGLSNSPSEAAGMISKDVPYRANSLLLPNLNSVSGKVQTLDIPLEVKYTMGKQFYATGGVSYALVLSQERFNHFTEYTDIPTFSSASNSGQPTNTVTSTVETAVQTSQNNVNTNGFGGFVNFSVGRKTNLTKFMKISVEPYIKIPVGQFKRADMDYTNGGLRVITNF